MYQHHQIGDQEISLHDCRTERICLHGRTLTFFFANGFFRPTEEGAEWQRTGNARMECHLCEPGEIGMDVTKYRKNRRGQTVCEDMTRSFLSAVNSGAYEFEFITVFKAYQTFLFCGCLWNEKPPYSTDCDIQLRCDEVRFFWND